PVFQVLNSYEAYGSGGVDRKTLSGRVAIDFLGWEFVGNDPGRLNVLDTTEPFDVRFFFRTNVTIRRGAHGVALFEDAHELLWSTKFYDIDLTPGMYEFVHSLPGFRCSPVCIRGRSA